MKLHTKIALLLLFLGGLGIAGTKLYLSYSQDRLGIAVSDAHENKGSIRIGVDNWVGYFPLCSPVMQRRLYRQGYQLQCIEDQADYLQRIQALANNQLDLAVATVDSYLLNGAAVRYPGAIIAVIDESKGGDALVAWQDKLDSIDTLRGETSFKIAFTPQSPSDHLLKAIAVHFDIPALKERRRWPLLTQGSEDALQRLLKREADAAVLWEPDVSKALQKKGLHVLLSTQQTRQLIVDVLIAGRRMMADRPEALNVLLTEYFHTLKFYRDNPNELSADVQKATGIKGDYLHNLLQGVSWQNLAHNAETWFAIGQHDNMPRVQLVETINSSLAIFTEYGSIRTSPLPDGDPYRIINSRFIAKVYDELGTSMADSEAERTTFSRLTERQWEQLQPVGRLKIRPIIFASGSSTLTLEDKRQLDEAAATLAHYPTFRIVIRGHTSVRGDAVTNKTLSHDRAEAVARYLFITHDIPPERMRAVGFGGEEPLSRLPGESDRAYHYRLPRVELILVSDTF